MSDAPYLIKNFRIDSVGVLFHDGSTAFIDAGSIIQLEYREGIFDKFLTVTLGIMDTTTNISSVMVGMEEFQLVFTDVQNDIKYEFTSCLLYTSPSPRD